MNDWAGELTFSTHLIEKSCEIKAQMAAAHFFDPDTKIGVQFRTWNERRVVSHQDPHTQLELRNEALRCEIRGSDLEKASATVSNCSVFVQGETLMPFIFLSSNLP